MIHLLMNHVTQHNHLVLQVVPKCRFAAEHEEFQATMAPSCSAANEFCSLIYGNHRPAPRSPLSLPARRPPHSSLRACEAVTV